MAVISENEFGCCLFLSQNEENEKRLPKFLISLRYIREFDDDFRWLWDERKNWTEYFSLS